MDKTFINSLNTNTSDRHRSLLTVGDKINLKSSYKYVALLTQYLLHIENIKVLKKNNRSNLLETSRDEETDLSSESYSLSDN